MNGSDTSNANSTVEWKATPSLPLLYDPSSSDNVNCTHQQEGTDGTPDPRVTEVVVHPKWNENETLPDSALLCNVANASYVYPCCLHIGGEAYFECHGTNCRIDASSDLTLYRQRTSDKWRDCVSTLARQLNDTKPRDSCLTAQTVNGLAGNSAQPTRRPATAAVALLVLLVAAAAHSG